MFRTSILPVLAVCAAGLVPCSVASAQTKVGVINFQKAILDTADIKKASTDLQNKFKPRQAQLEAVQRELNDIQTQLQSSQGRLSAAGEADLTARGQRKQRESERLTQDLQADVERERTDILQRAGTRMTEIVKKIADERGLDLVVDTTNTYFFKPALEITVEATTAYDKAFPLK
jgi:outer membrane protein